MQFELNITAFGFEGRHVKINMRPSIPSIDTVQAQSWTRGFVLELVKDVKHSGKWRCSQCGNPARDIQIDIISWLHVPEPKMIIYIHQLCENKDGPCDRAAKAESDIWRRQAGQPPNPPNSTRNINPVEQPLSRSCAQCHRDPNDPPELKLKRCSRCRLIRYCSVECQKADYQRHKTICKRVVGIEYGKWASDDRD
ncbi:hypothetical protein DFH09DRAFT_1122728 [Mycena vulgaris]|nr:hypothetical protein DFH09DRAFT_1122728 [Mycena vulgaris]